MQIAFAKAVMKSKANLVLLAAIAVASCSSQPEQPPVVKVDKPFAAAGSIEMQLDGGDYIISASPDERIRVSFAGNTGNAAADLGTTGTHANLAVRDTPHSNFRATVEVPATADLTVHLAAGNLQVAAITGNKDIDARPGRSGFRSQTPMTTVLWTLPSKLGTSTPDLLAILAQDFPRNSNGRVPASTHCAPVSAPATWN